MKDLGWNNNGIGSFTCGKNIVLKLRNSSKNIESQVNGKVSNYNTDQETDAKYD